MRSRTRSVTSANSLNFTRQTDIKWEFQPFEYHNSEVGSVSYDPETVTSTITDEYSQRQLARDSMSGRYVGVNNPNRGYRFSYLDPQQLGYSKVFRPNQRCTHSKTELIYKKDLHFTYYHHDDGQSELNSRFVTLEDSFVNGGQFLYSSVPFNGTLAQHLGSFNKYTAGNLIATPDWFAMLDSFNEALDSFIPQSFFVGEDLVEHEVFSTAIKLVLNPSRAISTLIKHGVKHVKNYRKKSLKHVAKELSKDGANGFLTWNFAIRPAIHDIGEALSAHQKVNKRMSFLTRNRGRYVPVRIKTEDTVNAEIPELGVNPSYHDLFWAEEKHFEAHLGAWAKVREDLTYGETWKAYLEYFGVNKVIGLAWELIPFSFVVDWFTNAQERLNSLTRIRLGGPFCDIQGICSSTKWTFDTKLYVWPGVHPGLGLRCTSPDSPVEIATLRSSLYNRQPGLPDTSGVVDFSTLGLFHGLAGASLIIQRAVR
jgi:hypothetical protein